MSSDGDSQYQGNERLDYDCNSSSMWQRVILKQRPNTCLGLLVLDPNKMSQMIAIKLRQATLIDDFC